MVAIKPRDKDPDKMAYGGEVAGSTSRVNNTHTGCVSSRHYERLMVWEMRYLVVLQCTYSNRVSKILSMKPGFFLKPNRVLNILGHHMENRNHILCRRV
jgi:hypothetical protein